MKGIRDGIVSPNMADVDKVKTWLSGTDIEKAMKEVDQKEELLEIVKKELAIAKKKLARSMRD